MPRETQLKKENDMTAMFAEWVNKRTEKGTRIYTYDYIYELIAEKFYCRPSTVKQIIYGYNEQRRARAKSQQSQ